METGGVEGKSVDYRTEYYKQLCSSMFRPLAGALLVLVLILAPALVRQVEANYFPPAEMVTPANGTTLTSDTQTFTWYDPGMNRLHQLYIGTTPGASDVGMFPPAGTTATSTTVTGLSVNGGKLYVRLWSQWGYTWTCNDYTYTAASLGGTANMVTPANGTTLTSASQTFTWTSASANLYQLWVGTTAGGFDIGMFPPAGTTGTTTKVSSLPTNSGILYVRLWSLNGTTWTFNDYTYTAASEMASMVTPANGAIFTSATQTFTWTNAGASLYQVWVGTTGGSSDIGMFPAAGTTATTFTTTGLPTNGRALYIRLWSLVGGIWLFNDYTYTAAGAPVAATMIEPPNGQFLCDVAQYFGWTDAGASRYQLWVGTTGAGSSDIGMFPAAGTTSTGAVADGLPANGSLLYVRLYSLVGANWVFHDYTYTASGTGSVDTMVTPANGTTISGASQLFTWTSRSCASLYQLWIGTTGAGSSNIGMFPAAGTMATSFTTTGLPASGPLNVRLWSLIGSTWMFNDYTYTAGP